jgi:argininosuccinate lyase
MAGLGRVIQDLLTWCTAELGYLRLSDGFVQTSSIMPQKRNPVALEHARGIASKALGQASAIFMTVHNTPFGDIVDVEDDLQPLVAAMFRDATRAVALTAAAMREAEFDTARLEARAAEGGTTLTELADHLVREEGSAFTDAHAVAARLLAVCRDAHESPSAAALDRVASEVLGRPLGYSDDDVARVLSARHFIEVRRTPGGPAPDVTDAALAASRGTMQDDSDWLAAARDRLAAAERRLRQRSEAL